MLDMEGICVSSGSACNSQVSNPSHVLKAMGIPNDQALSTIRITLGDLNTLDEITYISETLKNIVDRMRR